MAKPYKPRILRPRMRRSLIALIIVPVTIATVMGQDFVTRMYDYRVEHDVVYDTVTTFRSGSEVLQYDVYVPENGVRNRPVVFWIHGGAFVAGSRRDVAWACQRWAQRGYVAVSIGYRLGFYSPFPVDPPFAYDTAEVCRAAWRAIVDIRSAIHHTLDHADDYEIDTSRIVIGGYSAGAIAALTNVFLDTAQRRFPSADTLRDVERLFERFPRPRLESLPRYIRPRAVVGLFGGLLDTAYLQTSTPPLFLYHQTEDPVVACERRRGLWGMPLDVGANYPMIAGSCFLERELSKRGLLPSQLEFVSYVGIAHEPHNAALVDSLAAVFCAQHIDVTSGLHSPKISQEERHRIYIDDMETVYAVMSVQGRRIFESTYGSTWRQIRHTLQRGLWFVQTTTQWKPVMIIVGGE